MDFAFSEEQEMLRAAARDFLTNRYPIERVAALADGQATWDPTAWSDMAELGWLGLSVPGERGGMGVDFLDEAVLFEETGRALHPGPFFATVALALPALVAGFDADPRPLESVLKGERAATLAYAEEGGPWTLAEAGAVQARAEEREGGWALTGTKRFVPNLDLVDDAVVVARADGGVGLWRVDLRAHPGTVAVRATVDGTRRLGDLTLDGTPATLLVAPGEAAGVLERTRLRALAAAACEAVGVAQRAVSYARDHATQRVQFGKPVGAYQAVAHRIADAWVGLELARSLSYWAAWAVSGEEEQAPAACAAAKARASEAAVTACEVAIQVMGGMAFSWEQPLHRYYKRAQWLAAFEGDPREHRRELAAYILDR